MTVKLNDAITVSQIAHGLMLMTWIPTPVPDEQAFEAIKTSLDSVEPGTKMIINSGEFYGFTPRTANLELVSRFFEKYPDYADRAFLSVKGGVKADSLVPDSSPGNLRRSVDACLEALGGKKKLDLFQCARVDPSTPIEEAITALAGLIKEGKFDYIGISECSAATLRRAHAVHPITLVEIELSPWTYEDEAKKVIETAEELGIHIVGYRPLGSGFLAGKYKDKSQITGVLAHIPRLQGEAFDKNLAIVDALEKIAEKKGCTPAQLAIAWVRHLSKNVIPMPGSSHPKRTKENLESLKVAFTDEDAKEIDEVLGKHEVVGTRYAEATMKMNWG